MVVARLPSLNVLDMLQQAIVHQDLITAGRQGRSIYIISRALRIIKDWQ